MFHKSALYYRRAALLMACLLMPAGIYAQTRQRVVEKAARLLVVPEPIDIAEVAVGGRKVIIDKPFSAGEDWLRGITLKAQNISELPVRYVEFQVEAMPSGTGASRVRFRLKYGRMPGVSPDSGETLAPAAEVKPGEYFQVSFSESMYESLFRTRLRDARGTSPEKVRISLGYVVFEGDRAWKNGYMSRRDGANSQRWNVTDEDLNFIKPVTRMPDVGARAPGFTVSALDGLRFDLATMRGKVVVLNLWFVGCSPCRAEIPELNELVKDYNGKDVVFIAIASDGEPELRAFLKEVPFNFHVVPNGAALMARYGLAGFPRHVVIDRRGVIRWAETGNLSKIRAEFERALNDALEKR